jgi:large subunit ribosomal protein L28
MRQCSVCGKSPQFGQGIRYSHGGKWELRAPRTKRRWMPNLQTARVANGSNTQKVLVCAKCLKANKITRAA